MKWTTRLVKSIKCGDFFMEKYRTAAKALVWQELVCTDDENKYTRREAVELWNEAVRNGFICC